MAMGVMCRLGRAIILASRACKTVNFCFCLIWFRTGLMIYLSRDTIQSLETHPVCLQRIYRTLLFESIVIQLYPVYSNNSFFLSFNFFYVR